MPRKTDYKARLEAMAAKISKKQGEVRDLQEQVRDLKKKQDQERIYELLEAIDSKNLSVEEVIGWVNNYNPQQ